MLEVDLNLKMASALRSNKKVKDDTVIDAKDPTVSCLGTLRQIFLTKNPVWLRRRWHFCCMQEENKTVQQWWYRKLNKGRECDLEKIIHKDIQMLELIREIHSQALRKEFMKEKEPTLEMAAEDRQQLAEVC